MALHFDANQFEYAYKPKCFRNWEVPKWYPEKPCVNVGSTRIISNDRGNLLPGIPRSSQSPWGNYIGTWHMPKKITREVAEKLSAPNQVKIKAWERRCKRHGEFFKQKQAHEEPAQEKKAPLLLVEEEPEEYHRPEICDEKEKETKGELVPYVPGDLTAPESRHESYDELSKKRHEQQHIRTSADGFPKNREDFSRCSPPPEEPLEKQVEDFLAKNREMKEATYGHSPDDNCDDDVEKKDKRLSPIMDAISNFKLAKKLHKENLEHDPLPDTITDAVYRRLQMQRNGKDPGLGLEEGQCCTGIAWKGYPGYGATRCTKMKVFRPKTCIHRQKSDQKNERPSSVSSFDLKWRFIRSKKVSPIDLAICWDLIPENPKDEPKPPTHIDGSNGSQAPAVFTLVHTPKDEDKEKEIKCDGIHGCGPLFEHAPGFERDNVGLPIVNRPKTSSNGSIKSDLIRKRAQSAYNVQDKAVQYSEISSKASTKSGSSKTTTKTQENVQEVNGNFKTVCRRCQKYRLCQACETRNVPKKPTQPPKSDFKMAFKAGVPQKSVSRTCRFVNRALFWVPKQRDPYRSKNYAIDSLAPPFCLQKGKRQEYPEHCRLATVYQHSYKPLHLRKRPLLASIFK